MHYNAFVLFRSFILEKYPCKKAEYLCLNLSHIYRVREVSFFSIELDLTP